MRKLFDYADEYLQQSDWKDVALLKTCLAAFGVMIGLNIAKGKKKVAMIVAAVVFVATYIPLMCKFLGIVFQGKEFEEFEEFEDFEE